MVKVVVLKPEQVTPRPDLVGTWLTDEHYHTLVEEDMDLYLPPDCITDMNVDENCEMKKQCSSCNKGLSEKNIVFKFRKNYFSPDMVQSAYEGLRDAAQETQNRGTAAGPREGTLGNREWVTSYQWDIIDAFKDNRGNLFNEDPIDAINKKYETLDKDKVNGRAQVWSIERSQDENFVFDEWVEKTRKLSAVDAANEATRVEDQLVCKTTYANSVFSGIAGWYSRYPRIPYMRPTGYTRDNKDKFAKSFPYLQELAKAFESLLPWRYNNQSEAAKGIDPKFLVPGTPFTTVTVNKTFRTAAHYDPANMEMGCANIANISINGNYRGAYLVFPELGYAVDIRPGDLLFVRNDAGLHGNTEIILDDPEAERISCIAFTHESMLGGGSYEYEDYRKQFVEFSKNNKTNPYWKPKFNGVFPGMWADKEDPKGDYKNARGWYDFLKQHPNGDEWIDKHHPWLRESFEEVGLSSFFA